MCHHEELLPKKHSKRLQPLCLHWPTVRVNTFRTKKSVLSFFPFCVLASSVTLLTGIFCLFLIVLNTFNKINVNSKKRVVTLFLSFVLFFKKQIFFLYVLRKLNWYITIENSRMRSEMCQLPSTTKQFHGLRVTQFHEGTDEYVFNVNVSGRAWCEKPSVDEDSSCVSVQAAVGLEYRSLHLSLAVENWVTTVQGIKTRASDLKKKKKKKKKPSPPISSIWLLFALVCKRLNYV